MAIRFEFDAASKVLLGRLDGILTDDSLREAYETAAKYAVATDAQTGIWDTTSVTEFALSSEFMRSLASQVPIIADPKRARIIVASKPAAFGLFRMFQITGERSRPKLTIVHTLDEAFAVLGIQSPHFEPLE
jgi:hypothetical protein